MNRFFLEWIQIERSYWNNDLGDLKRTSVECGNRWKNLGCPRFGPAFECWKQCHYSYKAAIRKSKAENEKVRNDAMLDDLTNRDGVSFWQKWNMMNKVGNVISSRINGETDEQNIANKFATHFESVYSGSENTVYSGMKHTFESELADYYTNHIDDDISPYFVTWPE